MAAAPETPAAKAGRTFWRLWEKFFYLIAAVLFAFIWWASEEYGGEAVVRSGCAFFAFIGIGCLAYAWHLSTRAKASTSWLPVEARILESEVVSGRDSIASSRYSGPDSTPVTYFFPRVTYEYDLQGLTYTSGNIVLANVNYAAAEARAVIERYPAGARVLAYVDPADPRTAVLEPGITGHEGEYAKTAIVGGVFTAFGAAAWFLIPILAQ